MISQTRFFVLMAICGLSVPAVAQTTKLTARELFYAARDEAAKAKPVAAHRTPAKSKAPAAPTTISAGAVTVSAPNKPAPETKPSVPETRTDIVPVAYSTVPLGLRYTVLKRSGSQTVEIAPNAIFHSGDRIQLAVEVNDTGYLYVVTKGSSGTWEVLFPNRKIENGDNRVLSGRSYVLPPGYVFSFTGQPGVEKLFIIFSRRPEQEIDRLIYSLQGGKSAPAAQPAKETPAAPMLMASAAPLNDSLIGQLRNVYSRDLIIEKADDESATRKPEDKAVYVVNPKGSADSRVVADIDLTHQ